MSWSAERQARACLAAASGGGMRALADLVAEHGPVEVWQTLRETSRTSLAERARSVDAEEVERATSRLGLRFVVPGDDDWHTGLDALSTPDPGRLDPGLGGIPLGLWLRGPLSLDGALAVGLVGSRASSTYGERVASDLGADLAAGGSGGEGSCVVVSGGAYGIDAAAHRGALSVGSTMAVMAGGLDEYYPKGNERLLATVAERGLLVSEVAPGGRPTKAGFLARNRIIAALCAGVVVVEAAHRSGALNTAAWASRLRRQVMAVPGPVTSTLSLGTNRLLQSGEAALVSNAGDVRELLLPLDATREAAERPVQGSLLDELPEMLVQVRECLYPRRPTSMDEIAEATGLRPPECLAALGELEERGLVAAHPAGWVLAQPRRPT
ncbi:DNA-processing protein DprA [Aestuariimicrobium sp. T2.26MG-19.2B]|uniref:DNA-processing protein DprA n=1 Tax=Aestuariimicrobium sp. T2.26MG-19.2B TaxID=3040679 RepID=UPI00247791CE|nr:DNA-processing protein DprA [Aestuariimicrobium sp. T2.26MG-19.2B]CAI9398650.1 Putative DNA processing protein DprA [Aestuariimicrobium sp. T2.26MG-19.2B]